VVVDGADSRAPSAPFTADWGDGAPADGFSPVTHTYDDVARNHVLEVTAHYDDGTADAVRVGIYLVAPRSSPVFWLESEAVTIPSANVDLAMRAAYEPSPALRHLPDAGFGVLPREAIGHLPTVGARVQLGFVAWDVTVPEGTFCQVVLADPSRSGGMPSLWFTTPLALAASCAATSEVAAWPPTLHELGPSVALNMLAVDPFGGKIGGDANATHSEHRAQIFAHAALRELLDDADGGGLPPEMPPALETQAIRSFAVVAPACADRVDPGARCSSGNDPGAPEDESFGAFMTIASDFFEHAELAVGLATPVQRRCRFRRRFDEDWQARHARERQPPRSRIVTGDAAGGRPVLRVRRGTVAGVRGAGLPRA